jgi:hypothetical protein
LRSGIEAQLLASGSLPRAETALTRYLTMRNAKYAMLSKAGTADSFSRRFETIAFSDKVVEHE